MWLWNVLFSFVKLLGGYRQTYTSSIPKYSILQYCIQLGNHAFIFCSLMSNHFSIAMKRGHVLLITSLVSLMSYSAKPFKLYVYAGTCIKKHWGHKHLCVSSGTHSSSRPQPIPPPSSDRDSKEEMSDPWKHHSGTSNKNAELFFNTKKHRCSGDIA